MEFVVKVEGIDKSRWVLSVDPVGERFLIAHDDKSLHWVPMAECEFAGAAPPDQPRPVVLIQQPGQQIAVPNRAMRRNGP
ncbi:hypothetical protein LCGC14_2103590 [marine sediment metagenome]|uniref:Uncharacterized protein n=1 Tax=marine sediment metagenome TaxID=412755 RepID=A0A0F9EWC5_9ZZZZ